MAYPVTLNGRTYTLADFEGNNYVDGLPDAFEDFVTHAGDIYNDTSTTSNSIGTGSKTFTVASGKPYQAGTPLRIADAAAPATNFLDAVVTSYSGTTLVVEAIGYGGSGTLTSWTVNIGGAKTIDGTLGVSQGGTGATTAAAARTNLDVYSKTETYTQTEADSRFLNVSGEASDVTMTGNVTIGDADTDTLTINSATTTTADISFGDSDKAIFGAGSDLQIYHDGSNSYVQDAGDGALILNTTNGGGVYVYSAGETMATFNSNGAVNLYYDNAAKIATTSTGIDVTGTAVTDGLTVAGNVSVDGGTIKLDGNYPVGSENVALGDAAFDSNLSGANNVAIGHQALTASTASNHHVAIGRKALATNSSGAANVAIGMQAMLLNESGDQSVAVGYNALSAVVSGNYNVAVGSTALQSNTASNNTAVGHEALSNATNGSNTGFGYRAARGADSGTISGQYHTALGYEALISFTTSSSNTAIGYQSMYYNNTGGANVAVGHLAGHNIRGGESNVAVGYFALSANQSGGNNVAVGREALQAATATNNTALGFHAGYGITSGDQNVVVGYGAGPQSVTGSGALNVYIGSQAGSDTSTQSGNCIVGPQAGLLSTGFANTFIGSLVYGVTVGPGAAMTTGSKNTIIGGFSGNAGGLDIRTSNNKVVLSDGEGNPCLTIHKDAGGNISFGSTNGSYDIPGGSIGLALNGNDGLQMLDSRSNSNINTYRQRFYNTNGLVGGIRTNGSTTFFDTSSDYRLKENVVPVDDGIEIVKQLQPKRFNYIADPDTTMEGFIAHELQEVVPLAANGDKDAVDENGIVPQTVDLAKLIPILTAALQEAITKIETLEARITALENA